MIIFQKIVAKLKKKKKLFKQNFFNFFFSKIQISKEHRILLLNVVYQILELQRAEVSQGVMLALITLGINEMTSEKVLKKL